MIEKKVLDWLDTQLSVPVYMERPLDVPASFVLLEKTGSSMENWIYSVTIAVQSYAPTLLGAAQLNELVKAAMLNMIERGDVSSVRLNSDYNYTDTATKSYRYQAVFDIVAYDD